MATTALNQDGDAMKVRRGLTRSNLENMDSQDVQDQSHDSGLSILSILPIDVHFACPHAGRALAHAATPLGLVPRAFGNPG